MPRRDGARGACRRPRLVAGASALAHVIVDVPLPPLSSDRFILRDSATVRTLGRDVVLDPFLTGRRRRNGRLDRLQTLARGRAEEVLAELLQAPVGVDLDHFELAFNCAPQALRDALGVVVIGREPRMGVTRERYAGWKQATRTCLEPFYEEHSALHGMRAQALRDRIAPTIPVPSFQAFLHSGSSARGIAVRHGVARLFKHDVAADPGDRALWESVCPLLRGSGTNTASAVPRVRSLRKAPALTCMPLTELLYRRRAAVSVHRIGADRFCLRATLAWLASTAARVAAASTDGHFTVAQVRDAIGTGRLLANEILESLAGVGPPHAGRRGAVHAR